MAGAASASFVLTRRYGGRACAFVMPTLRYGGRGLRFIRADPPLHAGQPSPLRRTRRTGPAFGRKCRLQPPVAENPTKGGGLPPLFPV